MGQRKKFLVIGNYGGSTGIYDGQAAKRINITDIIKETFLNYDPIDFDYSPYKNMIGILPLFKSLKKALIDIDFVLIFPGGDKAIKILTLFFSLQKKKNRIPVYYCVVGGWLSKSVEKSRFLQKHLSIYEGIYVETLMMVDKLSKFSFHNVKYSPVFSLRKPIDFETVASLKESLANSDELRVCTFSRVCNEKGIGLAIECASKIANQNQSNIVLDIYGLLDKNWENDFNSLVKQHNKGFLHIYYHGPLDETAIDELSKHHLLVFPTFYKGEGFPIALLESFMAGLPVLASRWAYNEELIIPNVGFLFNHGTNQFEDQLKWCLGNKTQLLDMKKDCLEYADRFTPNKALNVLIEDIKDKLY